jgi:hypothetical protein
MKTIKIFIIIFTAFFSQSFAQTKTIEFELVDYGAIKSETKSLFSGTDIPDNYLNSSIFVKYGGEILELPIDDRTFNHSFFTKHHAERKSWPSHVKIEIKTIALKGNFVWTAGNVHAK